MSRDNLTTGAVLHYPFLWASQAARGETAGRKPRPTVVGFRIGGNVLLLFPVTTLQPDASRVGIEVPDMEKRRAGLDADRRCWIILDEINEDRLDVSVHIEPDALIGRFSRAFILRVIEIFMSARRRVKISATARYQ